MTSRHSFSVFEFGYLISEKDVGRMNNAVDLPDALFQWLEQRCLSDTEENDQRLLTLRVVESVKVLQVRNYVGVIALPGNNFIEVLPKTGRSHDNIDLGRQQLLMMLRTLKTFRHIATASSSIMTSRMPLMDIFIQQFVSSVKLIIRQGLKRDYLRQRDNLPWLKGKLLVPAQLSKNCLRRDRFQVEYDEYSVDRMENRLLKTAISKVSQLTRNPKLIRQINPLQAHFEQLSPVTNTFTAFKNVRLDRHMHNYECALEWAKLILQGLSPHCMQGNAHAVSLLFPMEAVFESFVAAWMRHHHQENWHIETQAQKYSLTRFNGRKMFRLKPDLWLQPRSTAREHSLICDTKWKLIDTQKSGFSLGQDDLYQMLAYGVNYQNSSGDMILIYPEHEGFQHPLEHPFEFHKTGSAPLRLWVVPFVIGESIKHSALRLPTHVLL